ncbi:hypothetical protein, partial [uncultured Mobiluncus sp.]|uniref:hypothetical protein n=1 Tax=uncultured Mobiluncus sp. TaxID=293425 RepID=UPI002639AEDD
EVSEGVGVGSAVTRGALVETAGPAETVGSGSESLALLPNPLPHATTAHSIPAPTSSFLVLLALGGV